jgi:hypothetical protein
MVVSNDMGAGLKGIPRHITPQVRSGCCSANSYAGKAPKSLPTKNACTRPKKNEANTQQIVKATGGLSLIRF